MINNLVKEFDNFKVPFNCNSIKYSNKDNIQLSNNFSLHNLVYNPLFDLKTNKLNEKYSIEYFNSITRLANEILEPIYEYYKGNLFIIHGFIAFEILSKLNVSNNYNYQFGETVDIYIPNHSLIEVFKELLKGNIINLENLSEIDLVRGYGCNYYQYISISISTPRLINYLNNMNISTKLPNIYIDNYNNKILYIGDK